MSHYPTIKKKLERNQVEPSGIFFTRIEQFGLNERVNEEARVKVKKKLKTRFACIRTVPFARKVKVHTDEDCYIHLQGYT